MKICVVGCGYLGAVHAACLASLGHEVTGIDVDHAKVDSLNAGLATFYEPGFPELLREGLGTGRLRFTTSYEPVGDAQVVFITVGTPQAPDGLHADLTFVDQAMQGIIENISPCQELVIVGKSTVPVGTAERLNRWLTDWAADGSTGVAGADAESVEAGASGESDAAAERPGEFRADAPAPESATAGESGEAGESGASDPAAEQTGDRRVHLVWNPEFLREGFAVTDTLIPNRMVYGVADEHSERAVALLDECYASMLEAKVPRLVTQYATAELVKVAANSFLATKISFINAMAELCDATGADVTQLAQAIGYDERIGRAFLRAGVGFGGGCLPKDIRAFMARAEELGVHQALSFLREVDAINTRQRAKVAELTARVVPEIRGARIAILGAAFKPQSDDLRDSPALDVARQLRALGAQVAITDPVAAAAVRRHPEGMQVCDTADQACQGADAVVLLTEWEEYRRLDPAHLREVVKRPIMIDGRNALDPLAWINAGWRYHGIGRHA